MCVIICFLCSLLFFFSSRRRHTRLQGDWSSDVCSSDLSRSGPARRRPAARRSCLHAPPALDEDADREAGAREGGEREAPVERRDRKSTRLNSSHLVISYAVFCLKKKNSTEEKQHSRTVI